MKQSVSHYVLPGEREQELVRLLGEMKLQGIENLIYSSEPSSSPFQKATLGCHLRFWPTWLDFYRTGRADPFQFHNELEIRDYYGAVTPEGWIETIRKNIRAALAENPEYLVWHVSESTIEESWTWHFHHTSREVLEASAEIYNEVADELPPQVWVLFENIFWPGLYTLEPADVDFFFSRLKGSHMGIILDTGHLMNTCPHLTREDEGAAYVMEKVRNLGEMRRLIHGIHLSSSLSGYYRDHFIRKVPDVLTPECIMNHIGSIDQHRPFRTEAASRIVELIEPDYVTHELFDPYGNIPVQSVLQQMKLIGDRKSGADLQSWEPFSGEQEETPKEHIS